MYLPSSSELHTRAADALSCAPNHRRLVLLYSGLLTLINLLVSALNFALESGIANTGGLQGMGLRSILTTIQTLLPLVIMVLTPFWGFGYTRSAMGLARKEDTPNATLLFGFRKFFPALGLITLTYLVYLVLAITCVYGGTILLSFTPLAEPVYELMLTADPTAIDPNLLLETMAPMLIICGVAYVGLLIPTTYRLRLSTYFMLDGTSPFRSLLSSFRATRGNGFALFRMDLGFWWYYLAQLLLALVAYGDQLLPHLGIHINETVAYFLFYGLSQLATLALMLGFQNTVATTYAHAYLSLLPTNEE